MFQIEAKLRPTALFKILTKKIKKIVFLPFFCDFLQNFHFFSKIFFFQFFLKNSFLSIFSSFYPILALIPSKCQKFVILFKKKFKTTQYFVFFPPEQANFDFGLFF